MKRLTMAGVKPAPCLALAGLALCAGLLASPPSRAASAPTSYTLQPLAHIGGTAGDVPIPQGLIWFLGPLNDDGQLLVDAGTSHNSKPEIPLQYSDGKFTPLVVGGAEGPVGPWPKNVYLTWPLSMNGRGDSVFNVTNQNATLVGTFSWDSQSGKMTAIAQQGMPATGSLTFTDQGTYSPAINNRDEIVLVGGVKGRGSPSGFGLFFRSPDGALQPIFVPGQHLPDGPEGALTSAPNPSITDAGVVAFLVQHPGSGQYSAYQWENGSLTPLAVVGMDAPEGGKIAAVSSVLLNNQNASALISARVAVTPGTGLPGIGLYRAAGGTLIALAVPGQDMPGGGKLKSIAYVDANPDNTLSISAATEEGQHAFVSTLDDNSAGIYRLDADGTLGLVVKTGMTTPLGTITRFGPYSPPAMNSKGQVAVSISFDNGPDTLVLLTPASP